MIIGIGTDIAEVGRIAKSIENKAFLEKVFSSGEIRYCEKKSNKAESYAARFAAKEAFFKALGTGWRGSMAFHEVEVVCDELGKPSLQINGKTAESIEDKKIGKMHLSLSHVKEMAIAMVVLEA